MEETCDVCGTEKDVQCEILLKGDNIDRMYHLCPFHLVEVYRRALEDFVENNEYKVNTYIKMVADKIIIDHRNKIKVEEYVGDTGEIDMELIKVPLNLRKLRPYDDDGTDNDYE